MMVRNLADIKNLFFDNKTVKQTIFKNTFWLIVAEASNRFLAFILFVYIARILGATEYGKFAFALSIIYLFNILHGLLSPQIITREFSRDKEKEKEYPAIISLKIILGLITIALILASSFFVTVDPVIRKAIWILAIYNFFNGFFDITWAFLRARQRMEYESFMKISQSLLLTAFGFFVIFNFPSVGNLGFSYLFATILALIPALIFFHFRIYPLSLSWNKNIWRRIISFSWPLALVSVFSTIHNQIDSAMMGYLGQITQNGWYNASFRIIGFTLVPMGLISVSFYPNLSKAFKESKERLQRLWSKQMEIMIFLALPLVTGGIVLAPRIIDFIYGQTYLPSVFAFQILIIMVGIIFLYNTFQQGLIVSDQQKKFFWAVLSGAVMNVVLNLILIPKYSLYGAAISTVISNILILFLLIRFILKFTDIRPFNSNILLTFIGAFLSSGVMYLVISQPYIYRLHIIISILIGVGVYLVSLLVLRFFAKTTI